MRAAQARYDDMEEPFVEPDEVPCAHCTGPAMGTRGVDGDDATFFDPEYTCETCEEPVCQTCHLAEDETPCTKEP